MTNERLLELYDNWDDFGLNWDEQKEVLDTLKGIREEIAKKEIMTDARLAGLQHMNGLTLLEQEEVLSALAEARQMLRVMKEYGSRKTPSE